MVTVPKDKGVRITSDLSGLNPYVVPERYPLPNIKDLFLDMAGSTIFSKLDLKKGFFHIALHPESRDLTATITPIGLRRYCRLPMGLTDSSSVFQRLIHQTLSGCQGCIVYIDDIIIHGRTIEEHDRRLRKVLSLLNSKDFRLQDHKCHFGVDRIPAFGHIISSSGITPDPINTKPITEAKTPTNLKEIMAFLGLINYFSEFIKDLASIAEPLRKLTRKDTPFDWTEECDLSFQTLQKLISEQLKIHIFDPNAPTIVTTDASDVGLGAILTQKSGTQEIPISCFSKTLSSAERNYAANEKEALGCIMACEHWEKLLLGRRFTLRTDHQSLLTLLTAPNSKRQTAKFERWKERLAAFDYTIEYLPGPRNQAADSLSRLYNRAESLGLRGIKYQDLQALTAKDETLQSVQDFLRKEWPNQRRIPSHINTFYKVPRHLSIKDGLIWFEDKIVAPTASRKSIIQSAHQGHPGIVRMKRLIRETYWWPASSVQAEAAVQHCAPCQQSAKSRPPTSIPKLNIPPAMAPGIQWAIDITGPFWNGRNLVVLLDSFSSYPEVLDTKDITSGTIKRWLGDIFARYGNPSGLLSDNGPQFTSTEFKKFLSDLDVHHYTSAVYNPQENGQVEVFNRLIKHGVQAFHAAGTPWEDGIRNLLKTFRGTPSGPTLDSPAKRFLGRDIRIDCQPNILPPTRRTRDQVSVQSSVPANSQQKDHGPKRGLFQRGDKVLSKLPHVPKGHSPYSAPKTVIDVLGYYSFRLSDGYVWNARKLKPFRLSRSGATQDHPIPPQHPEPGDGDPRRRQPAPAPQQPAIAPGPRRSSRCNKGQKPLRYQTQGDK